MKPDADRRRRLLCGASFAAIATGAAPGAPPPSGRAVTPPPAASCVVYKNATKKQVSGRCWNAGTETWETVGEGEAGKADGAVIQAAYDHLPERGGRLLVQSEEYRIDRTLVFRRDYTEIQFEKGSILKPEGDFSDFLIEMGGGAGGREVETVNISGLRIDGEKRSNGVNIIRLANSDHYDWRISHTRGEALWLQESAIEQGFYGLRVFWAGADRKSAAIRIGNDKQGVDHANNICFVNFRLIFPIGPLLIDCPPRQRQAVRNIYFYGSQIHWVMGPSKPDQNREIAELANAAVDLVRIQAGHDIHFIGGNYQFMSNRGRYFVIGAKERVNAVTIKGRIWGGGPGSTAISVVDAEDLFLPCTIRFTRGTAIDWGKNAGRVHEWPQVLDGEVRGTAPGITGTLGSVTRGDFGGNFGGFTPPVGSEGTVLIVADTNAARPGKRLYTYAAGGWNYVDLR